MVKVHIRGYLQTRRRLPDIKICKNQLKIRRTKHRRLLSDLLFLADFIVNFVLTFTFS